MASALCRSNGRGESVWSIHRGRRPAGLRTGARVRYLKRPDNVSHEFPGGRQDRRHCRAGRKRPAVGLAYRSAKRRAGSGSRRRVAAKKLVQSLRRSLTRVRASSKSSLVAGSRSMSKRLRTRRAASLQASAEQHSRELAKRLSAVSGCRRIGSVGLSIRVAFEARIFRQFPLDQCSFGCPTLGEMTMRHIVLSNHSTGEEG
jgi:hypothetical protein